MNVKSMARVKYSYNLDGINLTGVTSSNVVSTEVRKVGLLARKFASSDFYKTGDIMSYNLVVSNTGTNVTNNIVINDTITNQDLIPNTLKFCLLDSTSKLDVTYDYKDGNISINIPSLESHNICIISYKTIMGANAETATSKLTIESDDVGKIDTKTLELKQGYAKLECFKKVNDNYTYLNSNLTYELTLKNTGNISAYNVEVFDELPQTYELDKDNPIIYNDLLLPYSYENNILTFNLPEVPAESEVTVLINGRIIK